MPSPRTRCLRHRVGDPAPSPFYDIHHRIITAAARHTPVRLWDTSGRAHPTRARYGCPPAAHRGRLCRRAAFMMHPCAEGEGRRGAATPTRLSCRRTGRARGARIASRARGRLAREHGPRAEAIAIKTGPADTDGCPPMHGTAGDALLVDPFHRRARFAVHHDAVLVRGENAWRRGRACRHDHRQHATRRHDRFHRRHVHGGWMRT